MPSLADLAAIYANQQRDPQRHLASIVNPSSPSGIGFRTLPYSPNVEDRRGKYSLADLVFQVRHYFDPRGERYPERMLSGAGQYEPDIADTTAKIRYEQILKNMEARDRNKSILDAYETNPQAASSITAPIGIPLGLRR